MLFRSAPHLRIHFLFLSPIKHLENNSDKLACFVMSILVYLFHNSMKVLIRQRTIIASLTPSSLNESSYALCQFIGIRRLIFTPPYRCALIIPSFSKERLINNIIDILEIPSHRRSLHHRQEPPCRNQP